MMMIEFILMLLMLVLMLMLMIISNTLVIHYNVGNAVGALLISKALNLKIANAVDDSSL